MVSDIAVTLIISGLSEKVLPVSLCGLLLVVGTALLQRGQEEETGWTQK